MSKSTFAEINKYDKLGFAFNGGKESTVVFNLLLNYGHYKSVIYFNVTSNHDFPEIRLFLKSVSKKYDITILEYSDIKEAIIDLKDKYKITGILMGCRKTDPHCSGLDIFSPTDKSFPNTIRINPIINWSYKDVWDYIEENNVNVCKLYEKGYTSIGDTSNTFPNYLLFEHNKYKYAKYMNIDEKERVGRIKYNLPIEVSGTVVKGKQLGRKLGFPTANIICDNLKLQYGIYYGNCILRGKTYLSVMSWGENIHFNETKRILEVHILSKFDRDFYGDILNITITGYIRPMIKFNHTDLLIQQIEQDIKIAKHNSC